MNMKYFKLKYILSAALLILVTVFLILFFVGNLKASSVEYNNVEWNTDGFVDAQAKVDAKEKLETSKLVAEKGNYAMVINEDTTIISIIEKDADWSESNFTSGRVMYTTASTDTKATAAEQSNVILSYFDTDNKEQVFNSYEYSIAYEDRMKGATFKYYQLRYIDGGVDVLYNIGDFANVNSLFPAKFSRDAFEDMFIGNTMLYTSTESSFKNVKVQMNNGTTTDGKEMKFLGTGVTFSEEVATYLSENDLATVTPAENILHDGEDVFPGYWNLSNMLDEDGQLKLIAGTHYNCSDSPVEVNPFLTNTWQNTIFKTYYELDGKEGDITYYHHYEGSANTYVLKDLLQGQLNKLYQCLYVGTKTTDEDGNSYYVDNKYVYDKKTVYFDYNGDGTITEDEAFKFGGYQKYELDEDGNKVYAYDEAGNPVQDGFNEELAAIQNESFGASDDSKSISFQLCLRFTLNEKGLDVRLINDSIREGEGDSAADKLFKHECLISDVQILPYMTVNGNPESQGQIVLPDGSGSVISFNSVKDKQNVSYYSEKRYYGSDLAINQLEQRPDAKDLMFGMYGFLETSDNKGVVAIIDQGAGQISVEADFLRASSVAKKYNYARFTTYLRELENVVINAKRTYPKLTKVLYQEDIVFKYVLLSGEGLDYVDVANVYREYLIEKLGLNEQGDATKENNLSVNFLGAFTKKQIGFGYVYDAEMSLTTFKQAANIVSELKTNGINNMNVSYSFWTEDEMNPQITTNAKVSKTLGGKKGLAELTSYLNGENIDFYAEYSPVVGDGYDMTFGEMKYSAKSISGSYSMIPSFVLSTGKANPGGGLNVISPRFYKALVEKYTADIEGLGIKGLYLTNIGNERTSDYNRKVNIYSGISEKYQRDALKTAGEKVDKVMLSSPFDYVLNYVSYAVNVPTDTTLYPIVDYSIPLYQLVISGLFDYSGEYINFNNDNNATYNLLKAIETGSNISFMLSAEDTSVLLNTEHTGYYNSYYANWGNKIVYMNEVLNNTGIYESRLVDHSYITDNLVRVEYANGLTILINYDKVNYQDPATGITVSSNWFAVIEEGE